MKLDCGVLEAPLVLRCGDEVLDETLVLEPSTERSTLALGPMACEPTGISVGKLLSAELTAWCDSEPSPAATAFSRSLHVRGAARSVCSSSGLVASTIGYEWTAKLSLPSGQHRVALSTRSNRDREGACDVMLGESAADIVRMGRTRIALAFVAGPTALDVIVRCPGLAGSVCDSTATDPPTRSELLDVFVDVSQVE